MTTVGVIGAGVMGSGVAQSAAQAAHDVVLVDVSRDVIDRSLKSIERTCRMNRLLGSSPVDVKAVMARITGTDSIEDVASCEIVVENVTEDWVVKRPVYEALDRVCRPDAVFVVNTSAYPIARVASATARPEQVIGVHFMNPVPLKTAVELIPGVLTSPQTVLRTEAFLHSIGKKAIPVKDSCGFVSNRVLMLTVNEAAFLVHEGVASAETVDEVFRSCFGHPMGPLETADLIGVDTILYSVEVLYEHYADPKFRPCPLLKELVAVGFHGRKSGRGFYTYDGPAVEAASLAVGNPVLKTAANQ